MFDIKKASAVETTAPDAEALAEINKLTRRPLEAEEVYTFALRACDDQPDRDNERFSAACLRGLLPLYIGKTVLLDHRWSADSQCARVYGGEVANDGTASYLRLLCYMLRTAETASMIAAIDGGILREVSVGCACKTMTCSICGMPYGSCDHRKGVDYDGKRCLGILSDPTDAYEVSFVAVPAQPAAGVCKSAKPANMTTAMIEAAKMQIDLEKNRF